MAKKKFISAFAGCVAVTFLVVGILPGVCAQKIQNVGENVPPQGSLSERIAEYEAFLNKYLSKKIPLREVSKICMDAVNIMREEANVLHVSDKKVKIVGDTHSNLGAVDFSTRDFLEELKSADTEEGGGKEDTAIVFLGDYVGRGDYAPRGPHGIKNMLLLLKLKTLFPDKVVLLRGNHEQFNMCANDDFEDECKQRYGNIAGNVFRAIISAFDYLSLAAVVENENGNTLCLHGGVPQGLVYLSQLDEFKKPILSKTILNLEDENEEEEDVHGGFLELSWKKRTRENNMLRDLLWNDPSKEVQYWMANPARGEGMSVFGMSATNEFLEKNNLKRIIRAHQWDLGGFVDNFGNGTVFTVFSAPDYEGKNSNTASILDLFRDGSISPKPVVYTQPFMEMVERMKNKGSNASAVQAKVD